MLDTGDNEGVIPGRPPVTGYKVRAILGPLVIIPIGASNGDGAAACCVGAKEGDCTGNAVA